LLGPNGSGQVGIVAGGFSPFTLLTMLIDPKDFAGRAFGLDGVRENDLGSARVIAFVSALIAIGAYSAVVWSMYKSMVKNFDMTIRKQSR
jgi:hypothetical protein